MPEGQCGLNRAYNRVNEEREVNKTGKFLGLTYKERYYKKLNRSFGVKKI